MDTFSTHTAPRRQDPALQRLLDLAEIQQLHFDYGRHLDAGDFDAFADLFAEDAELLLGPGMRAAGRTAIRDMMAKRLRDRVGKVFHLITSPAVQLDGDSATAEVMWVVAGEDPSQPGRVVLNGLGRHRDELKREEGRWVISRRRSYQDLPTHPH